MYNETGKKYDFQRYYFKHNWFEAGEEEMPEEESSSSSSEEEESEGEGMAGLMKMFSTGVDAKAEAKKRKQEKKEERRMMAKLRQNKHWAKVSVQMKFKNVIRVIISKTKKEPDFVMNKFRIFRHLDNLFEGRMTRMINLKKTMAR